MRVSHKNKKEVTKFIDHMKGIYGDNMPVVRGKKHTYIGMDLEYSLPGESNVSMDSYITGAIKEFPEEMMQKIKTTAGNHLFKVDDASTKICER